MKLPQTWSEFGFEVEITGDQSPSLRLLKAVFADAERGESMHHSGGAAAETELIYGRVIEQSFRKILKPHFNSVGLGLGYVELTIAREALLQRNLNFSLESFEIVPELRELFVAWLRGGKLAEEIRVVYDSTLDFVIGARDLDRASLKACLVDKLSEGDFVLQGALAADSSLMKPAHALLFDAFSAKTNPDLWSDEFLVSFFKRAMAPDALISTYACRANLKRALRETGFEVHVREGFQGKRNSTLGFRGSLGAE